MSTSRIRLAEAQNWKCCWCGCETLIETGQPQSATIEHVVPKSDGGNNHWFNLVSACFSCNNRRGSQSVNNFTNGAYSYRKKDMYEIGLMTGPMTGPMAGRYVKGAPSGSCFKSKLRRALKKSEKLAKKDWMRGGFKINVTDWINTFQTSPAVKDKLFDLYKLDILSDINGGHEYAY